MVHDFCYHRPLSPLVRSNTNPRYKFFRQTHFTAGDYEQFLETWKITNDQKEDSMKGGEPTSGIIPWEGFIPEDHHGCVMTIFHTYMYLSEKFKKAIFLQYRGGDLVTFLPFSRVNFQNEFSSKLVVDPKEFSGFMDLLRFANEQEDRPFIETKIHKDIRCWYGNNGLIRNEFPISEADSGVCMLHDMFVTLGKERKVPVCDVFLNKRDFPLLKRDGTEAYDTFFGKHQKLLSHSYPKYTPILSMTTAPGYADIPIPTWDDWCRVSYWYDQRLFGKEYREYTFPKDLDTIPWSQKKATAVFRGSSTGLGTRLENNPRLFYAKESARLQKQKEDPPFLDVGITKWNLRPRKHPEDPYFRTIRLSEMPFSLVPTMNPMEQAGYKYILHLPGHSCAYRLGYEMFYGSVILLHPGTYQLWFMDKLVAWEHYIPIKPFDIDDLMEKIKWCREHDEECATIARNARRFAEIHLTRKGILDYLEGVFWDLYRTCGVAEYAPHTLQQVLTRVFPPTSLPLLEKGDADPTGYAKVLEKDNSIGGELCETRTTFIKVFHYDGQWLVHKKCIHRNDNGTALDIIRTVLNPMSKVIPTFIKTYTGWKDEDQRYSHFVMEWARGHTLDEFLTTCTLQELIEVWILSLLGLEVAQQVCAYLHMDLYPWNIMVERLDHPEPVMYQISLSESVTVVSRLRVRFIDYEKNHVVYRGNHFYTTSPFRYSRLQDVLSLVLSCLHKYLQRTIPEHEIRKVFTIMSFFESGYTNHQRFSSLTQIKQFLRLHKKYSLMLYEPKEGLEDYSPRDFFEFLRKTLRFSSPIITYHTHTPIWFLPLSESEKTFPTPTSQELDIFFMEWSQSPRKSYPPFLHDHLCVSCLKQEKQRLRPSFFSAKRFFEVMLYCITHMPKQMEIKKDLFPLWMFHFNHEFFSNLLKT